jgi:hypothetical protein
LGDSLNKSGMNMLMSAAQQQLIARLLAEAATKRLYRRCIAPSSRPAPGGGILGCCHKVLLLASNWICAAGSGASTEDIIP